MTDTTPDGLHKQVHGVAAWDVPLNENFDIIQARLTELQAQVDAGPVDAGPVYLNNSFFETVQTFTVAGDAPGYGFNAVDYSDAVFDDASGLLGDDAPYVSSWYSGLVWPALSWFVLPRGVWNYSGGLGFNGEISNPFGNSSIGTPYGYMDVLDPPSETGAFSAAAVWNWSYLKVFWFTGQVVVPNDPVAVGSIFVTNSANAPITTYQAFLTISKVG